MARGQYTETVEIRALRWLIAFAEDEASSLVTLAHAGKAFVQPAAADAIAALTPAEVRVVKAEVRALLRAMADKTELPPGGHHFRVQLTALNRGRGIALLVDGAPRDVLLYQTTVFLDRVGLDRLHRCPAPDCGRLFLKRGRREFCSTRCQKRVYLASYDPFAAQPRRTTTAKTTTSKKKRSRHGSHTKTR